MPEYVYALHDFHPENPDEVPFKVGEKIEVVEKDDLYGDGWWQGRNLAGQVGLFPQSYTSSTPPSSSSIAFPDHANGETPSSDAPSSGVLQTLPEESEGQSRHSPTESERARRPSQGDVMMHATMTDVQQAIEQLGRGDRDARSFSFRSSHGDYSERSETETEDEGDADREDELGWHRDARAILAERAQRQNEQRQAQEAQEQPRVTAMIPPIDVEVSDESDAEDDESPASPRRSHHQYPRIAEVDEEGEESPTQDVPSTVQPNSDNSNSSGSIVPSEKYLVPDETDLPTATAMTFPDTPPPPVVEAQETPADSSVTTEPTPTETPVPTPIPIPVETTPTPEPQPISSAPPSVLEPTPISATVLTESPIPIAAAAPPAIARASSGALAAEQLPFNTASALPSPSASSFAGSYGVGNGAGIVQALTPATTIFTTPDQSGMSTPDPAKASEAHPSEWSIDDVVDWLKSKGFDQAVCDKFIEQEITGDVLLELDANVLKSEIGIVQYGKRVRIANAIAELRRPPSVQETEQAQGGMPTPRSLTNSFNYPGSSHSQPSHSHTHSMQSSAQQSLFGPPSPSATNGLPSAGLTSITSADSGPHSVEMGASSPTAKNGWRASDPGSIHNGALALDDDSRGRALVGLGLGLPSTTKGPKVRPAQLVLSPSDGAIGETAAAAAAEGLDARAAAQDDRAVMSETESIRAKDSKARRRLFGRSADSGSMKDTASNHSGGTPVNTPPASASPHEENMPVRRRSKGAKSVDERKQDRLSLFGSPFASSLGKHARKPAPKLSNIGEEHKADKQDKSEKHDKHTIGTFSRLREKRTSSRPGTSDGTFKQTEKSKPAKLKEELAKDKEKRDRSVSLSPSKERDPALLRKRTSSSANHPTLGSLAAGKGAAVATAGAGAAPTLKAGQSIIEQIGEPDHNGWLRKKSERYNSWKLRYFVLKGPHLYWLKSNSTSETKIKGYVNIVGYKVLADENIDPGRYGFRIVHDTEKPHLFSSDEQLIVREWMKALMKATITRDYANPVMSSCNIPTIPLTVAQAMNPAPRPPSPSAREATQKALRRENPHQLSSRDAQVLLMGMPSKNQNAERARIESFFTNDTVSTNEPESPVAARSGPPKSPAPPRPSRELRRMSMQESYDAPVDADLIEWANSHLPSSLKITDGPGPLCSGLVLLRLAEDIRGKPASPPVLDTAFPSGPDDDKLDGLFRLFDYLLDNDVKMGTVSINDIRQGRRDKIVQLLRALKAWEDRRAAVAQSLGKGAIAAGPFMGTGMDFYRPTV